MKTFQLWMFVLAGILALMGCGLVRDNQENSTPFTGTPVPPQMANPPRPVLQLRPEELLTRNPESTLTSDYSDAFLENHTIISVSPEKTVYLAVAIHGQVIVSVLNVRQEPGPTYATVGTLKLGQVVDVVATNPTRTWVLIQTHELSGWAWLQHLELFDSPDELPVIQPSSTPTGETSSTTICRQPANHVWKC